MSVLFTLPSATSNFIKQNFNTVLKKSGFGDSSGNEDDLLIIIEESDNSTVLYIFLIIYMLLVLFYGLKSIDFMCPGAWDGNGIKWILLLLLFMTGGNIGVVYIIMAYAFNIKICK